MQNVKSDQTRSLYFSEKIRRMLGKVMEYPLTVVEAPMGYGKSTAVRRILTEKGIVFRWLQIFENSASDFWSGFCRIVGDYDPTRGSCLTRMGFPDDQIAAREAVRILTEIELEEPVVLVLDDYHLLNETAVDGFLEYLVRNEILGLHLVINARYIGFDWLEELKLKGYVHYVPKECFIFGPDEIHAYFELCGVSLKKVDPSELYSYTEGWISALYLLMLGYKEGGTFVTTASIYKLVEKAIYAPVSADTKEFLKKLCIFHTFTSDQAAHMWGKENTDDLLDEITKKNAFVTFDDQTKTYQIHHIFLNFLNQLVLELPNSFREGLHEKAAEWQLQRENYLSAMDHFYQAKNFDGLFQTLEIDKTNSFSNDHRGNLVRYYQECPEEIREKYPRAILICALCFMTLNELKCFKDACMEFAELMEKGRFSSEETNKLLGEFELLLSFTKYNDINEMLTHDIRAWDYLGEPAVFIDTDGCWTFGAPSVLYMFYRESGSLEKHVLDLEKAMPVYYQLTKGHGAGSEHIMRGEWAFNKGDFGTAEIFVHRGLHDAKLNHQSEIMTCCRFLQMRLLMLKGDYQGILDLYDQMHRETNPEKMNVLLHTMEVCIGYVNVFLGRNEKVPKWIAAGELQNSHLYFPSISFANIVYERYLLNKGKYYKFLGSVDEFLGIAETFPNLLSVVYTHIFIAIANEKIGRRDAAVEALRNALQTAAPDELYMPFVENGEDLEELLAMLLKEAEFISHKKRIEKLGQQYKAGAEKIRREYFREEKPKLTAREMDVALLVVEGYSNKEIGEKLYISTNTVKTILKGVFEKLNINSRALIEQNL